MDVLRAIVLVGAGLVVASATGAYALGARDDTTQTEVFSSECSIMFADGNPYWDEFSKTQLVEADKQVRRLPGEDGWLIILDVDSQRDRLVGDEYDSAERKARRAEHVAYYRSLDLVTDARQAIDDCIVNLGEP
ncbi:MAG: hypothetical protein WCF36_12580 [Candidatus Nanopelagicales bacterium]